MPKGIYPQAIYRPVPASLYAASITPTAVVLHSNAGSGGDLYGWWTNPAAGGLYSHFQAPLDGSVYQYGNIFRRAPANVRANAFGVSIETANNPGHSTFPAFDADTWSEPQRQAIIDLIDWICSVTGIPRRVCVDGHTGIGGHDWFSSWTTPGHLCPGKARSTQTRGDIIPTVAGHPTVEDDMTLSPEQAKQLAAAASDAHTAALQSPKAALYAAGARADAGRALDWGVPATLETIYQLELGRPVDQGGLAYWRGKIAAGATVDQVQAAIHDTPEAQRHREVAAA